MDPLIDPSGELRELAGDCVHCGFCLPACPTYQLWGEEMDSPRGRIHLIIQVLDGAPASESVITHLDRCLGCMACVPACPSGVRYDRLIEAARTWTEQPRLARRWPRPGRAGTGRCAPRSSPRSRTRAGCGCSPARCGRPADRADPAGPAQQAWPTGSRRSSLPRCASPPPRPPGPPRHRRLPPAASSATHTTGRPVTARAGRIPAEATAPGRGGPAHRLRAAGVLPRRQRRDRPGARRGRLRRGHPGRPGLLRGAVLARRPGRGGGPVRPADDRHVRAADVDVIVVNSAGCGSAMKEYAHLLADRRRRGGAGQVADFSEFLAELAGGRAGTRFALQAFPVGRVSRRLPPW